MTISGIQCGALSAAFLLTLISCTRHEVRYQGLFGPPEEGEFIRLYPEIPILGPDVLSQMRRPHVSMADSVPPYRQLAAPHGVAGPDSPTAEVEGKWYVTQHTESACILRMCRQLLPCFVCW